MHTTSNENDQCLHTCCTMNSCTVRTDTSQAMFAGSVKIGSKTATLQLTHTLIDDSDCKKVGRPLVHSQKLSEMLSHKRHKQDLP